jgi:hypothetical protein
MIAPVILKISPLLTLGKYGRKIYDWLDDQSWWPKKLVFTSNKRLARKGNAGGANGQSPKRGRPRRRPGSRLNKKP